MYGNDSYRNYQLNVLFMYNQNCGAIHFTYNSLKNAENFILIGIAVSKNYLEKCKKKIVNSVKTILIYQKVNV